MINDLNKSRNFIRQKEITETKDKNESVNGLESSRDLTKSSPY